jgi:hypothetical protein
LAVVPGEARVVDLIPAGPPREVLDELDVAAGVLDSFERLNVRFLVDVDLDEQPCVHASDGDDAWHLDPTALLALLAGDDEVLGKSRTARR